MKYGVYDVFYAYFRYRYKKCDIQKQHFLKVYIF